MNFDPENPVVKLCARGMELEGEHDSEALQRFQQAWDTAGNDLEKFIAAHYMARRQNTVSEKLRWDETALEFALKVKDENIQGVYPSLYLNIAKCYEDLQRFPEAIKYYKYASENCDALEEDGYGTMIRNGITNGLSRLTGSTKNQ